LVIGLFDLYQSSAGLRCVSGWYKSAHLLLIHECEWVSDLQTAWHIHSPRCL